MAAAGLGESAANAPIGDHEQGRQLIDSEALDEVGAPLGVDAHESKR